MIQAYLNYPNSYSQVHRSHNCPNIRSHKKQGQRNIRIDVNNISQELQKFINTYRFASQSTINDMWLEIDFDDIDFKIALVNHICNVLGKRYSPFIGVTAGICC